MLFVDALLQSPNCDLPTLGTEWPAFAQLCSARGLRGNAVQDAGIAMAARGHTAYRVTNDCDFARLLDRHEYTLLMPRH